MRGKKEQKFRMRKEKIKELREGKTVSYLAPKIGRSRQYLAPVFSGNLSIPESLAKQIIETIGKESIHINKLIESNGIEKTLFLFFEKD